MIALVAVAAPVASYVARAHPPRPGEPAADANYFYNAAYEVGTLTGGGGMVSEARPLVSIADSHSLAEISVESADQKQIVELGWNVDPGVNNGDLEPHLFAFHWIDGNATCYNGCGFVQVSQTHAPGDVVDATGVHALAIAHRSDGNWWLTYDADDVGYFPASEWSGTYTQAGLVQWFGEVAAGGEAMPCTQMGDGLVGSADDSASFSQLYTLDENGTRTPSSLQFDTPTLPAAYDLGREVATGFGFGGPGVDASACSYRGAAAGDGGAGDGDAGTGGAANGGGCAAGGQPAAGAWLGAAIVGCALARRRRYARG